VLRYLSPVSGAMNTTFLPSQLFGHQYRGRQRCTRRYPCQYSLLLGQLPGVFNGIFVLDLHYAIDHFQVEDTGDETGTDPLDLVRSPLSAGKNREFAGSTATIRVFRLWI